MNNLYTPSKLITKEKFDKLERIFQTTWVRETAFPDNQKNWIESNKALGQCAPTSLVINDLFGGRMIYDKANFHIWNQLPDGTEQDFSRSQFTGERKFSRYKYKTKEEMLSDDTGVRTNLLARYKKLKERVDKELS